MVQVAEQLQKDQPLRASEVVVGGQDANTSGVRVSFGQALQPAPF